MMNWKTVTCITAFASLILVESLGVAVAASPAKAVTPTFPLSTATFDSASSFLLKLFVIAAIFEAAMTTLFDWRYFAQRFEGKGVKTLIVIASASLFTWLTGYYVVEQVLQAFGIASGTYNEIADALPKFIAKFLDGLATGLVIAGGSNGIYTILSRVKVRDPNARKLKAVVPGAGQAKPEELPRKLDRTKNLFDQG